MQLKRLRIGGVPEHFNLPWKLAVANRAFDSLGVDLHYAEYPAGTGELTRALRNNELDAALVLTEGAVQDVVQHNTNRLIKVYVRSPLTWGIHVAAPGDIQHVEDIRGRRVAISRYGSGSHLIGIVDAIERGWSLDEMTFVVIDDLDGARRALAGGKADVFLWERHTTQPLVDNGEFRRVGERIVPWPAFVVSARREFISSYSSELRAALDVAATCAMNLKRRKSAAALVANTYGLQQKGAATWLSEVSWSNSYRRPTSALKKVIRALQAQQSIPQSAVDPDRVWHRL
ncbi:MAG: PhnD/SsuA/transferrin family substrate-binding protein [Woeseiaceae bacterium]|nr:PhnD/SsuA/transferrin family substrate-binding protein [Woeseiaceae bacterium]